MAAGSGSAARIDALRSFFFEQGKIDGASSERLRFTVVVPSDPGAAAGEVMADLVLDRRTAVLAR